MSGNPLLSRDLFVGRDGQLDQVASLLRQGRSTLLVGGRRAGKTTLVRRLSHDSVDRSLVFTDAAGWDLSTESSALGALLGAMKGRPETAHSQSTRHEVLHAIEAACPVALVIDEADRILQARWGPGFYSYLRWLDDTHLRGEISVLLVGGPTLVLFRDPDDKGSPPLNTAELRYLEPLDQFAVAHLTSLAGGVPTDQVMELAGGQAWLTTRLLAEVWEGQPLDEASDAVFDRALPTFCVWRQQLGAEGIAMIRRLPPQGLTRPEARRPPWSQYRQAASFARSIGLLRFDGDRIRRGPRLFFDWFEEQDPAEPQWDLAISYASEDEPLARQIHLHLRTEFKVFFAPEVSAGLWGENLNQVLPNTYGVLSRYVLVLSTPHYIGKHWTRVEYDAVASQHPGRILLVDLGEMPPDRPEGLVYRGSSPAELVGLVDALRTKLGR